MPPFSTQRCLLLTTILAIGAPTIAAPVVTLSTTANISGSGYDAIDFFYEVSPGAEFTCYQLNFGTSNGALIYDPLPTTSQDVGGDAIDTFMNTVGSLFGDSDASHIHTTYNPRTSGAAPTSIAELEWVAFDTFPGDTNSYNGNSGPYHLARILVQPDALWHASMLAFDTSVADTPPAQNFTNDPNWVFPEPPPPPSPAEPVPEPLPLPEPVVAPGGPTQPDPPLIDPLPTPEPVVPPPTDSPSDDDAPSVVVPHLVVEPWNGEFTHFPLIDPVTIDATHFVWTGWIPSAVRVGIDDYELTNFAAADVAADAEFPMLADDRFLSPVNIGNALQDYSRGQWATTQTAIMNSLGGLFRTDTDAAGANAPEPASAMLAALAGIALFANHRRRRSMPGLFP